VVIISHIHCEQSFYNPSNQTPLMQYNNWVWVSSRL
jgi:hypothetical protein